MRRRSLLNIKEENNQLDESLVDAWIFSGLRNEDAPDSIVGEKGIPLTCHNFAWNEEGSGFKDGVLWFDGVDDYLFSKDIPILYDYTVIFYIENISGFDKWAIVFGKGNTFKIYVHSTEKAYRVYTFSSHRSVLIKDTILKGYITPTRFNDVTFNKGTSPDSDDYFLSIGGGIGSNSAMIDPICMNIRYLGLYSRSLTEGEIQSEVEKLERIWSNRLNNN